MMFSFAPISGPLFGSTLALAFFCFGSWVMTGPSHPAPAKCQYSVRDVAFVNVHGKPWQLQLIKPAGISDSQFQSWNETLTEHLVDSNVSHIWFGANSAEATKLGGRTNPKRNKTAIDGRDGSQPVMRLAGSNNQFITFPSSPLSFPSKIEQLVNSPARRKIIDNVADSLCVMVLVESGNPEHDAAARQTVGQAIEQVNRQMWTLEKATDKGPALVTIQHQTLADESWLLASLEIRNTQSPSVAIIYGQGRRLGEVISGDDLSIEQLVARASICGQDCECRLDRDWLYGQQIIHTWDSQHERAAEKSLNFDPHSAFVMAEVSQIIQKNVPLNQPSERVLLGGGLRIHDLEPIVPESPESHSNIRPTISPPLATLTNSIAEEQTENPMSTERSVETERTTESERTIPRWQALPWSLILVLSFVAIGILSWRKFVS